MRRLLICLIIALLPVCGYSQGYGYRGGAGKGSPYGSGQEQPRAWSGSGIAIGKRLVATNHHVVDGAKQMQVTFKQNGQTKTYKAEVVVTDPTNDLAIIKIVDNTFVDLPKIPYVFTAKTEDVGTSVFALGYPKTQKLGEEIKFTDGTISAKTGAQGDIRLYQISVPITHGNSGGPLFDKQGNLIGITSSGWDNEDNTVAEGNPKSPTLTNKPNMELTNII